MRRIPLITPFLLLAILPASLAAQAAPRPAVGARVRVLTPTLAEHPQLIGRITAVDSAAVTIHTDVGDDVRLPRHLIAEVAVSGGATRGTVSVLRGATAGLLLGAVAGRLSTPEHRAGDRPTGLRYAVRGGVIGAIVGALFGAVNHPERWDTAVLGAGTLDRASP